MCVEKTVFAVNHLSSRPSSPLGPPGRAIDPPARERREQVQREAPLFCSSQHEPAFFSDGQVYCYPSRTTPRARGTWTKKGTGAAEAHWIAVMAATAEMAASFGGPVLRNGDDHYAHKVKHELHFGALAGLARLLLFGRHRQTARRRRRHVQRGEGGDEQSRVKGERVEVG